MPMLTHPGTAITAAWGLKLSHSISHKGRHPGGEGAVRSQGGGEGSVRRD